MEESQVWVDDCSRLENQLPGLRVLGDISSQTNSTGAFTRGVLATRNQVVDVLEQLRFAGAGISTQQDVDLRSGMQTRVIQHDLRLSALATAG